MKRTIQFGHFVFLITLVFSGCISTIAVDGARTSNEEFYILNASNTRVGDKTFFTKERNQIINRRKTHGFVTSLSNKMVGLSLSGGGIRSAAFQLGVMSGLNSADYRTGTLLNRVDYISSVSGGSWANGAYWAAQLPDKLLFECLDTIAIYGKADLPEQCTEVRDFLRTDQSVLIAPVDEGVLKQRKVKWEEVIKTTYLHNCDIEFGNKQANPQCWPEETQRSYPIFNVSHSVPTHKQGASSSNFPFQISLDSLGTIADCQSDNLLKDSDCEGGKGFFVSSSAKEFVWGIRKWQRYFKFWDPSSWTLPGNTLSMALATSSAVISGAPALSSNFDLKYEGHYIDGLRKIYKLSDGGKTENLGVLALVERGVDLIIISYMGKDSDQKNNPFEDLRLANEQGQRLLGCELGIPEVSHPNESAIYWTSYSCTTRKSKIDGDLLHIKPSQASAQAFIAYLGNPEQKGKYLELRDYLHGEKEESLPLDDRFPQTPTFETVYPEKLIQGYYLFGKWLVEQQAAKNIKKWLEAS
jgi:patatin-like phospholipase